MRDKRIDNPLRRLFQKLLRNRKAKIQKPKVWVMEAAGCGYVEIPKVASTSITRAIAMYLDDAPLDAELPPMSRVRELAQHHATHLPVNEIRQKYGHLELFTFVRNPLERLYSCYADKIIKARETGHNILWSHGFTLEMTFPEFVHHSAVIPDREVNRHLKSQSFFVTDDQGLVVSRIGRMENLAADWQALHESYGLPLLPHINPSSASVSDYRQHYTPELAALAMQRYAKDIELFGYGEALEPLLQGTTAPE